MDKRNVKAIIALLIRHGGATIPSIADALSISIGTATKEVTALQNLGILRDSGKTQTATGRKPHLFTFNPEAGYYAGVDLNDKFVSLGLMDTAGQMARSRTNVSFRLDNTPESLRNLCDIIREHTRRIPQYRDRIRRICINIPGRVNGKTGFSYTNFNFTDRPLTEMFSETFGIPVCISNDTRSMAYAEFLQGCVKDEKDVVFVNVNWGLGVGLILDGKPYFGKSGFSGEFGHIHAFDNQQICRCGKKGCLETEVSGQALRRKLLERIRAGETSILSERVLNSTIPLSLEEITDAVRREDTLCIEIIEEIGSLLGIQVASLLNLLNPELVVIGGELAMTGDYLLQPLKTAINKHALSHITQDTDIRISALGEDAGVKGACLVARSSDFGIDF